jgi:TatA/E family protein of Tat protein translocase
MIGNLMGGDGLIVIVVALVVLVGGSQLPKIARNVGLAGREFRKAQAEAEEEKAKAAPAALPATPAGAAPVNPVATPQAGGAPATGSDGSITLTPAQLEALLKAREEQAHTQPGAN